MPIIAYYHKIAGSKPSGFRQAYLIGLKFKKLKYDKSADIHSDIDVSDSHNNFSLSRPRKPLQ